MQLNLWHVDADWHPGLWSSTRNPESGGKKSGMKGLNNKTMHFNLGKKKNRKWWHSRDSGVRKGLWSSSVEDGLKTGQPAIVRNWSCTQAEHRASPKFPAALGEGHLLHFPVGRLSIPVGWINLCFFSCYTSLFQRTLKMKPVPSLTAVKGNDAKNIPPLLSLPPDCLSVSRC